MKTLLTMKKILFLFGLTLVLTACGSDNKKNDASSDGLTGAYFVNIPQTETYYFINEKEVLNIRDMKKSFFSYIYKYTVKGNKITIHNRRKENAESKNTEFTLYNNEVLVRTSTIALKKEYRVGQTFKRSYTEN